MGKNNVNTFKTSTFIRSLYSVGFSSLMLSFYKTNLSFGFCRYIGKNNVGFSQYDTKNFVTSTINYEGASLLYQIATSILDGKNADKEINAVLQCNNATLTFEYKPDENNQMTAYLTINKNNQLITFKFNTIAYGIKTQLPEENSRKAIA